MNVSAERKNTNTEVSSLKEYRFLFTSDGFDPDFPPTPEGDADARRFREHPWESVYALGFTPATSEESSTYHWVHTLALTYVRVLSRQPALEITREQTEVSLLPEDAGRLLEALPFGIGTENVTADWLNRAFERLTAARRHNVGIHRPPTVYGIGIVGVDVELYP